MLKKNIYNFFINPVSQQLSFLFLLIFFIPLNAHSLVKQRIVILSPNLVEIAHTLIKESKTQNIEIIGVIHYLGEPNYTKNITGVGTSSNINVEKILLLKPDIILANAENNTISLQQIKSFGIKIDVYHTQSLSDIAQLILQIGNILSLKSSAKKIANNYLSQLKFYREKYANNKKKQTFIQLSKAPIFTVGGQGILNEIINLCGAINIFEKIKQTSFQTGQSSVLTKDPEVIIELFNTLSDNMPYDRNINSQWHSWSNLSAVQNNMIYNVNPNLIAQNTPQILNGIAAICNIIKNDT